MKKIFLSLIIVSIIILLSSNIYAYENSIYKIEVPSDYVEIGTDSLKIFMKDISNAIMIYCIDKKIDRDISSISDAELKEIVNNMQSEKNNNLKIISKEKTKLGNANTIHLSVQENNSYGDMYLMTSNKHMVMVSILCGNKEELNSNEIIKIKESFKFKESFFDIEKIIKYGFVIIIIIYGIIRIKRRNG